MKIELNTTNAKKRITNSDHLKTLIGKETAQKNNYLQKMKFFGIIFLELNDKHNVNSTLKYVLNIPFCFIQR